MGIEEEFINIKSIWTIAQKWFYNNISIITSIYNKTKPYKYNYTLS